MFVRGVQLPDRSYCNGVMMIPCKHWSDCGMKHGGCCGLEQPPHGKRVSLGICMKVCEKYDGPDRGAGDTLHRITTSTGIAALVKGAVATVNAVANKVADATGKPRPAPKDCGCGRRRNRLNEIAPSDPK